MKFLKKSFVTIVVLFFSNFVFAKNLVFLCVQNLNAPKEADKMTFVIEDLIFSSLFDTGIIASNVPFMSNDADVYENIKLVSNSLESSTEYILIINLDYESETFTDKKTGEKIAQIKRIKYSLFNTEEKKLAPIKSASFKKTKSKNEFWNTIEKENKNIVQNLDFSK